jgi:molecular chaperone GrpE (heat shock protein)
MTESNANSQHEQLDSSTTNYPCRKIIQTITSGRRSVRQLRKRASVEKVKAELDALRDRMARLQAEFENARKRAAKEQQDFKGIMLWRTHSSRYCPFWTALTGRCRLPPGARKNSAQEST